MFVVGEDIIYGNMGVCRVEGITVPDFYPTKRECYVLRPLYMANSKVYTPVEDGPMALRPLMSAEEGQSLIDGMPDMETLPSDMEKQELQNACREATKSGDFLFLARLVKTLHEKKAVMAAIKKNISSVEKECFDSAESILYGELAVVLDIPVEEVGSYVLGRLTVDVPGSAEGIA